MREDRAARPRFSDCGCCPSSASLTFCNRSVEVPTLWIICVLVNERHIRRCEPALRRGHVPEQRSAGGARWRWLHSTSYLLSADTAMLTESSGVGMWCSQYRRRWTKCRSRRCSGRYY